MSHVVTNVPVIDLGAFEAGTPSERRSLASAVDEACRETGFLTISGHGVPDADIAAVRAAVRAFFDGPAEAKVALRPGPGRPYGYLGVGSEALARSRGEETPPDLKESFNGGPLTCPADETDRDALAFCYAPTPWPEVPGFRAAWETYYAHMEDLAARIMAMFAVALGKPEGFFQPYIDSPISALRALNYPATEGPAEAGQQRAGAHTDYGSLTILLPDSGSRGLEILAQSGDWVPVDAPEGVFVINIGDLMELWTGGRWRSTLHRVVVPPELAGQRRGSLAFFHQPNWHAAIRPFEGRADAVTSGPYLMGKFAAATG
ncbi:isopenicillin N synthase family dioxygenase [Pelagovum pacificum]|uniref:2-oxoglutarate-dependent ethylene/succinate-forming enzyme n=1 Tax=Pelagovum pacificum TaxID=2588711 RepID=A0A5C5GDB1_9RHOB|nr:2-oxoglutarate and iron-dependent oxygenase domain-containing protein [Pelagovum pacificum]QQA44383.1 isopenicillin N synthase family oxygenase [Pelagovum pacificum]TNY32500.1 isopenicillin N synthase family oxygenase [Pelagovum pacificum]